MFVHKVQSCFETFCMSDFSRFLNSELVPCNYCNKKGIIVIMSGLILLKEVKLHQHAL